uniref:Uncharacterized protein n=1 Tax=virus sp. ctx9V1 TaxID=2828001 RepID=A0A8S5RE21_9VIRU|nr:MAG TPA: hypothetical protein [virus sp. ctx9V1]
MNIIQEIGQDRKLMIILMCYMYSETIQIELLVVIL